MNKGCIMNGAAAATAPANAHAHDEVEVDTVGKLLLADAKLSPEDCNANVASSASQEDVLSNYVDDGHHHRCHQRAAQQQQAMTNNEFAAEHRIFLHAILDLLTERDHLLALHAADGRHTNNSPNNAIIKIGYLRKASRRIKGLWKTKFVEIRKGSFSYFDVNAKQYHQRTSPQLVRKDITLRTSTCTCRAIKTRTMKFLPNHNNSVVGGGSVFELRTNDGRRRYWMANTPEERQDWMQTIHNSMIGASVIRGDNFLQYQVVAEQQQQQQHGKRLSKQTKKRRSCPPDLPYREYLEQYLDIRAAIHDATAKEDYCAAVSRLRDNSITIPVQWIKAQLNDDIANSYFVESEIPSDVEQLWKDLLRDTVEMNGEILSGDSFHGPERIIGKLTQLILSSDASVHDNHDELLSNQDRITEAQAIAYARDILLASGRTRSGGDSYFCAENLCLNRDLVVLCPSSSSKVSPLSINVVSTIFQRQGTIDSNMSSVSGNAFTRSGKIWTRQYLVLSHGVLSCYAEDETEPRTLLEKVKVQGAKVHLSRMEPKDHTKAANASKEPATGHIVTIATNVGKIVREYLFEDEHFSFWHNSLKRSTDTTVEYTNYDEQNTVMSNGHDCASGIKSDCCAVDVVVNVCTEYNACTLDPSGIDSEDTWAALNTTFIQKFTLTGGPNGRISRGDEVVQMEMHR